MDSTTTTTTTTTPTVDALRAEAHTIIMKAPTTEGIALEKIATDVRQLDGVCSATVYEPEADNTIDRPQLQVEFWRQDAARGTVANFCDARLVKVAEGDGHHGPILSFELKVTSNAEAYDGAKAVRAAQDEAEAARLALDDARDSADTRAGDPSPVAAAKARLAAAERALDALLEPPADARAITTHITVAVNATIAANRAAMVTSLDAINRADDIEDAVTDGGRNSHDREAAAAAALLAHFFSDEADEAACAAQKALWEVVTTSKPVHIAMSHFPVEGLTVERARAAALECQACRKAAERAAISAERAADLAARVSACALLP